MDTIPDTSADVLELGLGATDAPYLGTMSVMEQVVRGFFSEIVAARRAVEDGKATEVTSALRAAGARLQRILYGQDPAYAAGPWNSERHLGRALVEQANMGGSTSDAVVRLSYAMAAELGDILNEYDAGNLADDDMQFRIDERVEFYTYLFMGLPVPTPEDVEDAQV